jgi:molecular chaperone IbpA
MMEDVTMRYDLSPLFRSTVGFDRMASMLDSMTRMDEQQAAYPPYNIEKIGDNQYRISMAVAGFREDELDVEVEDTTLTVKGRANTEEESTDEGSNFLYRGIARRAFERRFQLAEFIEVAGAKLENGLLHIDLVREVPERMKPRSVAIESKNQSTKTIEGKKAQKAA